MKRQSEARRGPLDQVIPVQLVQIGTYPIEGRLFPTKIGV